MARDNTAVVGEARGQAPASATGAAPPAIRCRGLTKAYDVATGRSGFAAALRAPTTWPDAGLALDGVDLEVPRGQALGVIGPNGAGKSTLLKVIGGITGSTAGSLDLAGSVRSVIELGVGFHTDLTGLENIRCLGVLHGQTLRQIDAAVPRIVEFAGIGDAVDLPLKQYSLGMRARLGFAVVTDVRPDILVVDEVLSVGDQDFQARCFARIATMIDQGTTLVFVSHEMGMVATMCERVVQLRRGRVVDDGPTTEVIERYLSRSASHIARATTSSVTVLGGDVVAGTPTADSLRLWVDVEVHEPLDHPGVGFDVVLPLVDPGQVVSASDAALVPFTAPGRYRITGATDAVWGVGRNMRFQVSVIDRARQRVLGQASLDAEVVGDLAGRELSPLGVVMNMPLTWSMARDEPADLVTSARPTGAAAGGEAILSLRDVAKHYRARTHGATIRPAFPGSLGELRHRDVAALDAVTLDIARGESVGLIGPNASGKTTLLRVVAGVTRPDVGTVSTGGRVMSLLELGAGFHADLTGLENLRVLGRLMGLDPQVLDTHVDEAIAFADLRDVIDHQMKTYSTGMRARLGLSMALVCPADVMLIDEVLAVGDEEFRRQAIGRLAERCRDGLTVLFVSHDLAMVEQVCDRVVRLDHGRVVDDGPTDEVIGGYAGSSWAGGVHDAEGGIRLQRLQLERHHISPSGRLEIDGQVMVDEPVPDARLELSLRSPPEDRTRELSIEERGLLSAMIETVVPTGQELTQPGTYRFHCSLDAGQLVGEVDVVLSAVDEDRGIVLAEVWEQVVVGAPAPGSHVTFEPRMAWSVEPLPLEPLPLEPLPFVPSPPDA